MIHLPLKMILRKDGSVTIYHRNIQTLAVEMFKVKNNLSPKIIQDLFKLRNDLPNIRSSNEFCLPTPHTVKYGTESLRYLGPKIWNILPNSLKKSSSLYSFKVEIKKWIPHGFPCKLCKNVIPDLGYTD